MHPNYVIDFWVEAGPQRWFAVDEGFDAAVAARFDRIYGAAARGDLPWRETAAGALALILLLDQAPRNMFRRQPRAYATDPHARALANLAVARGFDSAFALPLRRFFYLPLMHSENLMDQRRCEALCALAGDVDGLRFARGHRAVIERFGRFPHRNPVLGRTMTAAEQAFLDSGGFAG